MAASRPVRCRSTSPPKRKPRLGNGHQRPFRSTNPGPLPESSMDADPQESLLPSMSHMSGHVSPIRARTIKEYDQEITELRKENFNLKLRLYFLEEKIDKKFDGDTKDLHKANIQLKVEVQSLQNELEQKTRLLQEALGTLEKIEEKHRCELVDLSNNAEQQIMILQDQLSSLHQELQRCQGKESETDVDSKMYKQAFGLEDTSLQSFTDSKQLGDKNVDDELEELQKCLKEKDEKLEMLQKTSAELEEKTKTQEKHIVKRTKAIQGLVALLQEKEKEITKLQKQTNQKRKESSSDSLDSQTPGALSEVHSQSSSSEATGSTDGRSISSPDTLVEISFLKKELKNKRKIAKDTESLSGKNAALEHECFSLHHAVKDKDLFIQYVGLAKPDEY